MRRTLVAALVICHFAPLLLHASPGTVPDELNHLAEVIMAGGTPAEVLAADLAAQSAIGAVADPAVHELNQSQRLYMLAFDAFGRGATEEGERYVAQSMAAARASIRIAPSSEAYRVLADCLNRLLNVRGSAYKLLNFRDARAAADEAVRLDDRNPLAHLSAASYYLSAPGIAGGDVRRGLGHVESAARLAGDSRYVRFLVAMWEARGAARAGSRESARTALERAAEIYPDNWWLAEVRAELGL